MLWRWAGLALLLAIPTASAFASLPPDVSPHHDITEAGAERAGFPEGGIAALQAAVVAPDLHEMEWDPDTDHITRVDARGAFRAEHHCDRVPPAAHLDAFNATVAYIRAALAEATNASHAGDAEEAMEALGGALHAAQDCSSHSNAIDLGLFATYPGLVLGDGPPPSGLWLTGFIPDGDDPEAPPGDPYAHGDFAKDSADGTPEASLEMADGRTKYAAAKAMAEDTTALLLERFLAGLSPAEVEALGNVEADASPLPKVGVPGVAPAAIPVLLGMVSLLVRGRR